MMRFPPHYEPLPERPDKPMDDEFEHENSMKTKDSELRELDAWIAEHVMGKNPIHRDDKPPTKGTEDDYFVVEYLAFSRSCPLYTTDPDAAMQVLEKCQHLTDVVVYKTVQDKHGVRDDISDFAVDAETLPLAICKFAKKLFSK